MPLKRPQVFVVTPYLNESEQVLWRCHDSVVAQSYTSIHVMVADGAPATVVDGWAADHILLPKAHGDIGSTPRLVGAVHAIGLGADAIAFLDADNWYERDHIAGLIELFAHPQAAFLSSSRTLRRRDGSVLGVCPMTDPDRFIDTNCMMFTRAAFPLLFNWVLMPHYAHLVGDRVMLQRIRESGASRAHSRRHSVNYTCAKPGLYIRMGEQPPADLGPKPPYAQADERWIADGYPPLM